MNIELIKAILHVLDPAVDAPILSEAILPPSEDALQYLAGHAAKCFASDEAKACTLADDSAFLPPVSYTHLDVYKRQLMGTQVMKNALFPMAQLPSGGFILLALVMCVWRAAAASVKQQMSLGAEHL